MSEEKKELTYGQKAVGVRFNPSGMDDVDKAKQKFAELIDVADDLRKSINALNDGKPSEGARLCSVAITEMQTAQMWLVKALTFKN